MGLISRVSSRTYRQQKNMVKIGVMGGTGECGKALLENILKNQRFSQIHLIARRSTVTDLQARYPSAKISESVVDFDVAVRGKLESNPFEGCQQVFCCMGTTKANAGSA